MVAKAWIWLPSSARPAWDPARVKLLSQFPAQALGARRRAGSSTAPMRCTKWAILYLFIGLAISTSVDLSIYLSIITYLLHNLCICLVFLLFCSSISPPLSLSLKVTSSISRAYPSAGSLVTEETRCPFPLTEWVAIALPGSPSYFFSLALPPGVHTSIQFRLKYISIIRRFHL